jgi:hypothetical protein
MSRASGAWEVADQDRLKQGDYGRVVLLPADYADFVNRVTGYNFGEPFVPSFFQQPINIAMFAVLLFLLPIVGWKIYNASWIGNPCIWTSVSLLVFTFATSGVTQTKTWMCVSYSHTRTRSLKCKPQVQASSANWARSDSQLNRVTALAQLLRPRRLQKMIALTRVTGTLATGSHHSLLCKCCLPCSSRLLHTTPFK